MEVKERERRSKIKRDGEVEEEEWVGASGVH
jgi:hypothetical protein